MLLLLHVGGGVYSSLLSVDKMVIPKEKMAGNHGFDSKAHSALEHIAAWPKPFRGPYATRQPGQKGGEMAVDI